MPIKPRLAATIAGLVELVKELDLWRQARAAARLGSLDRTVYDHWTKEFYTLSVKIGDRQLEIHDSNGPFGRVDVTIWLDRQRVFAAHTELGATHRSSSSPGQLVELPDLDGRPVPIFVEAYLHQLGESTWLELLKPDRLRQALADNAEAQASSDLARENQTNESRPFTAQEIELARAFAVPLKKTDTKH